MRWDYEAAPGARIFRQEMVADLKPIERLAAFENWIKGGVQKSYEGRGYLPISSDNPNANNGALIPAGNFWAAIGEFSGYASHSSGEIANNERAAVTVGILRSSTAEMRTSKETVHLKPGDIYLIGKQEGTFTYGPGEVDRLIFPMDYFADVVSPDAPISVIRENNPVAGIIKTMTHSLLTDLTTQGQPQKGTLSKIARNMVYEVLSDASRKPVKSRYELIQEGCRAYVEENLMEPSFDIEALARRLNASRATLYRAFEGIGGVREYIRNVRLDVARKMLERQGYERGSILNVSYDCGFSSPSQFGRAFKARFAMSPSQFVATQTTDNADGA